LTLAPRDLFEEGERPSCDQKEVMDEMTLLFEPFAPLFELSRMAERSLAPGLAAPSFVPAADVVVTDDDLTVVMDVPGVKADDLSVELEGDVLTVRGERPLPTSAQGADDGGRVWQRLERGFGQFERAVRVPQGLDPEAVTASMSDGVMTVHIPMPESRKPRRVEIATSRRPAIEEGTAEDRELAGATT
jgi:HSP20 family protein